MARMPTATWLGEHAPIQEDGKRLTMTRYDVLCFHTIVGFAPAHAAHFSVRADGTILQSRDTAFRSGANLNGNHRVIAIEVEDHGVAFGQWDTKDGHAVPAFTAEEIEALAQIIVWAHRMHDIPIQPCPDSKPTSRGVAYHRQGIDGNFEAYEFGGRVDGGENWSTSFGKVCPGDRRIAQIPQIIALARQIIAGLQLTVLTANLGRGVTEAELTANVHKLRHSKAVKGFQEIDEADRPEEHAVLARELPPGWAAFDTRVPINVPPPWRIVRTRITKACDGLAHFTPHRVITQALIELLDDNQSVTPRLVVVNLHFPRRSLQTLTRRRKCRRALRAVIAYWHGLGVTVVWMGDTNQVRMRKMHDLEQSVVDAGLDHIRVVPHPEGVQVEVLRKGSVDLTIDGHDAHYARLRLTTPKETTS